jgi:hypothetical protein
MDAPAGTTSRHHVATTGRRGRRDTPFRKIRICAAEVGVVAAAAEVAAAGSLGAEVAAAARVVRVARVPGERAATAAKSHEKRR